MVTIRAFKGLRPPNELAAKVAAYPYDVINSDEARELAKGNPYSFLHINKPEIDLPLTTDLYAPEVYQKAKENLELFCKNGTLIQDKAPALYIYRQTMGKHSQYGLVTCVAADEYYQNKIKKHELTRKKKEDDRTLHTLTTNCNAGPVFLTYKDQKRIDLLILEYANQNSPDVDFTADDKIGHTVWRINNQTLIENLIKLFKEVPTLYIADGHHRAASAARVKLEKQKTDPDYSPDKEYNFFMAALFPASQLQILDYNRVLLSLNGHTKEGLLEKLAKDFTIKKDGVKKPKAPTHFSMYLGKEWYTLKTIDGSFDPNDPIASLDCTILQENILKPIFGIDDPRTSENIDFVGGIRGHKALEKLVDSGKGVVAFRLHPTSIKQLMSVADQDKIMPPKSTWFEPKLRSGLIVHLLS